VAQRDWAEKDYYAILGVKKDATKEDIKRAYRKLAQKHHPDANPGDKQAEMRFKEISEAHAILSNDEKRAEYDQIRAFVEAGGDRVYGFRPGGGGGVRVNIGDIFGEGFDDLFGFRGGRHAPLRGADLESSVSLPFDEAIHGATISLSNGTRVRVPPGVQDGARIRVAGKGQPGPPGGEPGDLYVRVAVAPHPVFTRDKNGDLRVVLPVSFPEAALGSQIEVPTLDGSVKVKIPPGTESDRVLRVRGRGAPRPSGGPGDLLVEVRVEVPRRLSRKEKEALEAFASVHKANPRAHLEPYLHHPAAAS
jgi:molecular chaperone DnaJ